MYFTAMIFFANDCIDKDNTERTFQQNYNDYLLLFLVTMQGMMIYNQLLTHL